LDRIDYTNKVKKVKIDLNNSQNLWEISNKRPQIEIDLTELQKKYFESKTASDKHKYWQEMFLLVQRYGKSLILKRKKGGKYVDPEEIEDSAIQVAVAFMSQYLYRPDFYVGVSFAGMMTGKVMEALYKQLPDDKNWSLNETIGDSENEFSEIQKGDPEMQSIFREIPTPEEEMFRVSITKELLGLFEEFDSLVKNEIIRLKLRFYIFLFLKRPRNKHVFPTFFKYQCNKQELDLIQLFELELYKRLSE
jgi:hypothetical protein